MLVENVSYLFTYGTTIALWSLVIEPLQEYITEILPFTTDLGDFCLFLIPADIA